MAMMDGIADAPMVLVVEDEAIIRLMLVDELEDAGFAVIEAEGADAAVALLLNGATIRAVITDVKMPGSMDGLGLAAWMRDQAPRVPIIITSGFATEPNCAAINPAITCVVPKPYSPKSVTALVIALLS
ncbi:MAG: response regulator [Sphingomonas bacterium]|nr:response regulator [Sphingomonas bacterium]